MRLIVSQLLISLFMSQEIMSQEIFNFTNSSDISEWMVVDDIVMGGRSSGFFQIDKDGHGVFTGEVSLENNGGFSSVRYDFDNMQTNEYTKINIRLRGDGKKYQFSFTFLLKNNDFHCPGWSGAAGMEKSIDSY